ncbi:MAG: hypothetical protein ACYTE8_04220 [Planctomycetota bacterium]|jgi:hypothetical protein
MASAKLKESLQKLSVLKSYTSLIIPIAIIVIAVVLFAFTFIISEKLKDNVNRQSVASGNNAASMIGNVPSEEQSVQQAVYQKAYEEDAQRISLLPKESTQRQLISYKIFPKPQDTSWAVFEEFAEKYRNSMENMVTRINARDCPTQAELNKNTGNQSSGSTQASSNIKSVICKERANSISVYANPSNLAGYTFWENYNPGTDKDLTNCWYWQLGYWIIEDVITTVESMNYGSNTVPTSPVKRIMTVNFDPSIGMYSSPGVSSKKAYSAAPKYVLSPADEFTISYTGKFSNNEIDVIHFNISVILEANSIPRFIQELCKAKQHTFRGFSGTDEEKSFKHNLITILETQINPVDTKAPEHELYFYGGNAIVKLDLICEYIFIKAGYDEIVPEVVKSELASKTPPPM